jgi:RimJ/RimL family protein N-acetyltransferase
MTDLQVTPVILTGNTIRLEPLQVAHVAELAEVGRDPSIWQHMLYGQIDSEAKMLAFVEGLLARQVLGSDLPFAVIHLEQRCAIGCTRYLDIQPHNRNLEVGGTWYGLAYQRTAVNTEAKYLLFWHAFETLGAVRVQLKTDVENLRSQRAIERLGAVREGVLRNHMLRPDGSLRSSVYYSILAAEWPAVKSRLAGFLQNPPSGTR